MVAEADLTTPSTPQPKRHRYTKDTSARAIKNKLKKIKETTAFVQSLHHQPIEVQEFRLQEFLTAHPNKRKEVVRELMEQSLFMRLNHQRSLIASGDPLKKAEARKEDLGIGLEFDKLYKEQDSEALTVRIPSALAGRLSGVLALKIDPVKTVNPQTTPTVVENQNQEASNTTMLLDKSYPNSVHE